MSNYLEMPSFYLDVLLFSGLEDHKKELVISLRRFHYMYTDEFNRNGSRDGSGTDRGLHGDNPKNGGLSVMYHVSIEGDL